VLSILVITVKDELILFVVEANDLRECWIMLKDLYASQNAVVAMYLTEKLHSISLEEGSPMS